MGQRTADRRRAAWCAAGSAACAAATAVLYLLAVRTGTGQSVEESVVRGAQLVFGGWQFSPTGRVGAVSVASVALGTAVVVAVALVRRRPRLAVALAVTVGGSLATVQLLKHGVLGRPPLVPTEYALGRNSFPSGHTAVGFVLAVATVLVLPLRVRPWAWVVVGMFGATFGLSTVVSADHRPSDVVAGHLVVAAWALAVTAVLVARRGSEAPDDPSPASVRAPLAVLGVVALVGAAGAGAWAVVVARLDPADVDGRRTAFVVMFVGVLVAEAALATAALLVAYRRLSLDPPVRGRLPSRPTPWEELGAGDDVERVTGIEPA